MPDILFINAKRGGAIGLFGSIGLLLVLPWLDTSPVRRAWFRPIYKWVYWPLIIEVAVLDWVTANCPEGTVILIGRLAAL